jgi:sucrose-6-phosphate hydrolase SacC (GH32 family)
MATKKRPVLALLALTMILVAHLMMPATNAVQAQSPYAGYLFAYFKTSAEAVHYAYSTDALRWTSLNNGNPILTSTIGNRSLRDPFIIRKQNGTFNLLATNSWASRAIVVYDSTDLINWTSQRLVTVAPSTNTFAWAPEAVYDPGISQYRIFFASNLNGGVHKMYTVSTSNFTSVSGPSVAYDPGSGLYAIDGTIHQSGSTYYMFFKYSDPGPAEKGIQRVQATNLAGPWGSRSSPLTDFDVEGVTVVKLNNENRWYMYYDYYRTGAYGVSTTTSLGGSWTKLMASQFTLPPGVRHGTIVPITSAEMNALIARWGGVVSVNDNTTGTGNNQFQYTGTWSYGSQGGAFQNDNHWSSSVNANYQVRFNGRQIRLYGARAPNHGIAAVSIDSGTEVNVDFYAATRADNTLLWTSPTLAAGNHTLRVRVSGTKNASSSGTPITADRVDITP